MRRDEHGKPQPTWGRKLYRVTTRSGEHPRVVEAYSERGARRQFGRFGVSARQISIGPPDGAAWLRVTISGARLTGRAARATGRGIRAAWLWWRDNDAKPPRKTRPR
ncbi:hypothetical protein [Amycolatopsis lexingtonensis]|uniref:hypothetical protein n=1 Tax=Amycolatopsis lexingtonensis TaxID=218822 RepID=UPI003F72166B